MRGGFESETEAGLNLKLEETESLDGYLYVMHCAGHSQIVPLVLPVL